MIDPDECSRICRYLLHRNHFRFSSNLTPVYALVRISHCIVYTGATVGPLRACSMFVLQSITTPSWYLKMDLYGFRGMVDEWMLALLGYTAPHCALSYQSFSIYTRYNMTLKAKWNGNDLESGAHTHTPTLIFFLLVRSTFSTAYEHKVQSLFLGLSQFRLTWMTMLLTVRMWRMVWCPQYLLWIFAFWLCELCELLSDVCVFDFVWWKKKKKKRKRSHIQCHTLAPVGVMWASLFDRCLFLRMYLWVKQTIRTNVHT